MNFCAIVACYVVLTCLRVGGNTALNLMERLKKLGYRVHDKDDILTGKEHIS
jgi:hypothetical protein